jgi:hypothetical protein
VTRDRNPLNWRTCLIAVAAWLIALAIVLPIIRWVFG